MTNNLKCQLITTVGVLNSPPPPPAANGAVNEETFRTGKNFEAI